MRWWTSAAEPGSAANNTRNCTSSPLRWELVWCGASRQGGSCWLDPHRASVMAAPGARSSSCWPIVSTASWANTCRIGASCRFRLQARSLARRRSPSAQPPTLAPRPWDSEAVTTFFTGSRAWLRSAVRLRVFSLRCGPLRRSRSVGSPRQYPVPLIMEVGASSRSVKGASAPLRDGASSTLDPPAADPHEAGYQGDGSGW